VRYLILDSMGNAVDAFRTRVAAQATLRAIVEEEPEAADALVLLAYDDQGQPVGEAVTYDDLPPPVRVRSVWTFTSTSSGLRRTGRKVVRSSAPEYVSCRPPADLPVVVPPQSTLVPN